MENIINELLNEKENINKLLEEYLEKQNKKEYFFLIENLIKISSLHGEIGYTTPLLTLKKIENNTFEFDIKEYIDAYKTSESELEKEYYLNIIKNSETLTLQKNEAKQKEQIENATNYLKSLISIVKQRGILILNKMDKQTRNIINKASDNTKELATYTIYDTNSSNIVIRYINNQKINIKETIDKAKFYYNKGQYENAVEEYLKIASLKKPKKGVSTHSYIRLGLAYAKLKKPDLAIDYLSLASHLLKEGETKNFINETIEKLNGKNPNIEEFDEKTYVAMSNEDFLERSTNNLDNIIKELLKKENKINDIIEILNLNEEEKLLALIIEAQCFYKNEMYKLGDKNLKKVELSSNKTEKVITELIQTRKDRKLYKHR